MRYEKADDFDDLMWWGTLNGPLAPPGNTSGMAVDRDTLVSSFEVLISARRMLERGPHGAV